MKKYLMIFVLAFTFIACGQVKRIDQFPGATTLSDADLFLMMQSGTTKNVPWSLIRTAVTPSGVIYNYINYSDPSWLTSISAGKITGTLSGVPYLTANNTYTGNNIFNSGAFNGNTFFNGFNTFDGAAWFGDVVNFEAQTNLHGNATVNGTLSATGNFNATGTSYVGKATIGKLNYASERVNCAQMVNNTIYVAGAITYYLFYGEAVQGGTDLSNIDSGTDGQVIILQYDDDALSQSVFMVHADGNIKLSTSDYVLSKDKMLTLIYYNGFWRELSRVAVQTTGGGGLIPALPNVFPNLIAWYYPGSLYRSPQAMAWQYWNDSSGHGNNLSGTMDGGVGEINGLSAFNSGGTTGAMNGSSLNSFTGHSYTFIMVDSAGTGNYVFKSTNTSDGSFIGGLIDFGDPTSFGLYGRDKNGFTTFAKADLSKHMYIIVATLDAATGTFTVYMNGSTYQTVNPSWDANTTFEGSFTLMNTFGTMGEFIAYSDLKDKPTINRICQKLSSKFNLPWTNLQ